MKKQPIHVIYFFLFCIFIATSNLGCMQNDLATPPLTLENFGGLENGYKKVLFDLISHDYDRIKTPQYLDIFWGKGYKHKISPQDYLNRFKRYLKCSPECYILALIYMFRLAHKYTGTNIINEITFHRIFLASMILTIKWNDDKYLKKEYYAKVGGVTIERLNELEMLLFKELDYNLYIYPYEWNYFLNLLAQVEYSEQFMAANNGAASAIW